MSGATRSATRQLSAHARDFVDEQEFADLLRLRPADPGRVREIIARSLAKQPLGIAETAELIRADDPETIAEILEGARALKREVYGNRIVLFAPLYIGSLCVNDCSYCAFRRSNPEAFRRTLTPDDIASQILALEDSGHKRVILVFGEHPTYGPGFIAECVRRVYQTRSGSGEIRRVNVNAAPLDHDGFRLVKDAGIGTYQIFQETYHHATYARVHPASTWKGDFAYRLDAPARAIEAGCDDVGIGALFGLHDWRFEVLGLVAHAVHLQAEYGVGPHTISFPRLQPAVGTALDATNPVTDEDFKRLIAILRLAVPYTGLILTAREPAGLRREAMVLGVSQIDAGSRIELLGYTEAGDAQRVDREQFRLSDVRSLDEVMRELILDGHVPSFCTSCYRLGRTGEHFMEFAVPGFIKRFCTPNALLTLMEYLVDYAAPETAAAGRVLIQEELAQIADDGLRAKVLERLRLIESESRRDLYF